MIDVRIYTTSYCGFCQAAKALLQSRAIAFEERDVTSEADERQWLVERTGQRTVPQIFLGGVPIGGFRELSQLDRSGDLERIVKGEQAAEPILPQT
jgi:glutaredoxin 3